MFSPRMCAWVSWRLWLRIRSIVSAKTCPVLTGHSRLDQVCVCKDCLGNFIRNCRPLQNRINIYHPSNNHFQRTRVQKLIGISHLYKITATSSSTTSRILAGRTCRERQAPLLLWAFRGREASIASFTVTQRRSYVISRQGGFLFLISYLLTRIKKDFL